MFFFHEEFRISWDDLGNFKQKHGGILTTVKCVPAANSVAFFVLFFFTKSKKKRPPGMAIRIYPPLKRSCGRILESLQITFGTSACPALELV